MKTSNKIVATKEKTNTITIVIVNQIFYCDKLKNNKLLLDQGNICVPSNLSQIDCWWPFVKLEECMKNLIDGNSWSNSDTANFSQTEKYVYLSHLKFYIIIVHNIFGNHDHGDNHDHWSITNSHSHYSPPLQYMIQKSWRKATLWLYHGINEAFVYYTFESIMCF